MSSALNTARRQAERVGLHDVRFPFRALFRRGELDGDVEEAAEDGLSVSHNVESRLSLALYIADDFNAG